MSGVHFVQNTFHSHWWNSVLEITLFDGHLIANFPSLASNLQGGRGGDSVRLAPSLRTHQTLKPLSPLAGFCLLKSK